MGTHPLLALYSSEGPLSTGSNPAAAIICLSSFVKKKFSAPAKARINIIVINRNPLRLMLRRK
jgi:hypothetical protein